MNDGVLVRWFSVHRQRRAVGSPMGYGVAPVGASSRAPQRGCRPHSVAKLHCSPLCFGNGHPVRFPSIGGQGAPKVASPSQVFELVQTLVLGTRTARTPRKAEESDAIIPRQRQFVYSLWRSFCSFDGSLASRLTRFFHHIPLSV